MAVAHVEVAPTPTAPGRLPGVGHAVQLVHRPLEFMRSVRELGDLAWMHLGPQPVLVVNSPAALHRMLVSDAGKYDQGKYFDKIRETFGNGLPVSDGPFHHRQRRLIQPAFHHQRIGRYLEVMNDVAAATASSWRPGTVVPLRDQAQELTLTMVARTLFSADIGPQVYAELQRYWATVARGVARRTMSPVELLERIPTPGNRRYESATARIKQVILDAVMAERDKPDDGSLLAMLFEARDEDTGQGMDDEQVVAEVLLMLFAGTETSGFMTAWFFYELSRNPHVEQRVHAELDAVLGADGRIGHEDLPKLPYVRAVLTECLRRYHPGWLFMRRSRTEVELAGRRFPAGTELAFSINALHRDPDLYPDPLRFDPDRWGPDAAALPPGAFIPFLIGRRQCIGDSFAWAQMFSAVAAISSRWWLRPEPGYRPKELPRVLMCPDEVPMLPTPRR